MTVRVFISYAYDSAAHREAVRHLYELLRACGIDARWDLEATAGRQDWPVWMAGQVDDADFVVVVASPAYRRRAEGGAEPDDGRGVQFEAALLRERLYADRVRWQRRILPVVLPGQSAEGIPTFLQPYSASRYEVREFTVDGADELIRVLTDQPAYPAPPLGAVPALGPRTGTAPGAGAAKDAGAAHDAGAARSADAVRRLLLAQRDAVGASPDVAALGGHLPDASSVYVALRAGRVERAGADAAAAKEKPRGPVITDLSLVDAVRAAGGAVLVGEPGAGKSTAMARVVAESAAWWLADVATRGPAPYGPIVPVVARATQMGSSRHLPRALAAAIADAVELPADDLAMLFEAAPADGMRWLVVVDGLDEVVDAARRADLVRRVAGWMREPVAPYRVLVATRPLREGELGPVRATGATEYRLRPFDAEGLEAFATKWFHAVDPDADTARPAATIRRFLARVDTDSLRGLIRSPLLATIAAAVFHEAADGNEPLPHGRARLYDSFVRLLLRRRRSPRDVAETAPDDVRARVSRSDPVGATLLWELFLHMRDLLGHLASRRLAGDPARLADLATAWVSAPHEWSDAFDAAAGARARRVVDNDPAWPHLVPALLAETGLMTHRGTALDFVHPSFAEYLAAGYRVAHGDRRRDDEPPVTVESALAATEDDATRSYGLFALAAAPPDDAAIEALMNGGLADLTVLAAILGDGVPMHAALRQRAIDTVIDRCRGIGGIASPHDTVVAAVAADPHAVRRLVAIGTDDAESAQRRFGAARLLATAGDPDAAVAAVRPLLDDPEVEWHHRERVAGLLLGHGDREDRAAAIRCLHALLPDRRGYGWISTEAAKALAEHGDAADRDALARYANDPAVSDGSRAQLAELLVRFGDPHQRAAALALLRALAPTVPDAVRALAEHEGTAGLSALVRPGVPVRVRVAAADALVRGGSAEERLTALEALAAIAGTEADDADEGRVDRDGGRVDAAQILAAHGSRDQVALVRRLATDESVGSRTRLRFAAALLTDGPQADREPARAMLERIAADRSRHENERAEAIRDLVMDDGPAGLEVAASIAVDASEPIDLRWRTAHLVVVRAPRESAARGALAAMVTEPPTGRGFFDESVGGFAAEALAEFGGAADRSLLVRVCADDAVRPNVRRAAAAALYEYGTAADRSVAHEHLTAVAADPHADLLDRDNAAVALAAHGGRAAHQWLWRLTATGDPDVRYGAAQALAKAGPPAARAQARRVLLHLVTDPTVDGAGRVMAAERIAGYGTAAELAALAELARDPAGDEETRLCAAIGLTHASDPDLDALGERVLTGLATDAGVAVQVRYDALERLAWYGQASGLRLAAEVASDPAEHPSLRLAAGRVVLIHEGTGRRRDKDAAAAAKAAVLDAAAEIVESPEVDDELADEAASLLVAGGTQAGIARALRIARDPFAGLQARVAAASAVYERGDAADRAAVAGLLNADDVSAAIRVGIAKPLLDGPDRSHSEAARTALAAIAVDTDVPTQVRWDALFRLTYRIESSAPVLGALMRNESAPAPIRCDAAEELLKADGDLADEAAEVLVALAADPAIDWWTATDAVVDLHQHRPAALRRLAPALDDPRQHAMTRFFVAMRLVETDLEDLWGAAVDAIRALAHDPGAGLPTRAMAARALSAGIGFDEFATFDGAPALVRIEAAAGLAERESDADSDAAADDAHAARDLALRTLTALAEDRTTADDLRGHAAATLVESALVTVSWVNEFVRGADSAYAGFVAAAAALKSTMDGVDQAPLLRATQDGSRAARGDRLWLWGTVTLGQYGDDFAREVVEYSGVPVWAESDPLVLHLAEADWVNRRDPKPRKNLESELMRIVGRHDSDPAVREPAARELVLHGTEHWRMLARAIVTDLTGVGA